MSNNIMSYFSGDKLYGDDFSINEIEKWFADEAEGYAALGAKDKNSYHYAYHELNNLHAFKFINKRRFSNALGIGSAYGHELKPIIGGINKVTILDPSDAFSDVHEIMGTQGEYIKPVPNGDMPFKDNQFDLITSLGVMHHIPNVSHVMNEAYRCLDVGGVMLLREPIVSMGDWTKPRRGLTKRERGIPLHIMRGIIENSGFEIIKESLCVFPLVPVLANKIGVAAYNSRALSLLDKILSKIFSWNIKYHRTKVHEKFAPASVFYLLSK